MNVRCTECGRAGEGTSSELLAAGWAQAEPKTEQAKGRAPVESPRWVCPACVVTHPSIPRSARKR